MPFNASIAILARLSGAGLEPLTVAVAQTVSSKLPIGVKGEQRLNEAMSTFKVYGSFGEVVWFGVGIRHILRSLVQTSQGASSVALTAALSEGFSNHVAALVLYELPKCFGSPSELTPSFAQWERYVNVCSGIFSGSGFCSMVAQISKVLGFTNRNNPVHWRASEAKDIAKFLRYLVDIVNGRTESMEVVGGSTCSWAYVLCDYIFGIRVQIVKSASDGQMVVFQNFDSAKDPYQVRFTVLSNPSGHELTQARATFSLLPAELKFIHRQQHSHFSRHSLDWCIPQDAVLKNFFGPHACQKLDQISPDISELFGAFALLYHWSPYSRYYRRYATATELLHRLSACLPETEKWIPRAEENIEKIMKAWQETHGKSWGNSLQAMLNASRRSQRVREEQIFVDDSFATRCYDVLHRISDAVGVNATDICCTILLLSAVLCDVILDDPLELRRYGLAKFYATVESFRENKDSFAIYDSNSVIGFRFSRLLKQCLWLYSGNSMSTEENLGGSIGPYREELRNTWDHTAISSSGIYCFVEYLRDPLQPHSTACKVHIGRGSIEINGRLCPAIQDQDGDEILPYSANVAGELPRVMNARAMVEESTALKLWFEQWNGDDIEKRQAVIPGEALQARWYGSKGFWRGPCGTLDDPEEMDQEQRQQWMSSYGAYATIPLTLGQGQL